MAICRRTNLIIRRPSLMKLSEFAKEHVINRRPFSSASLDFEKLRNSKMDAVKDFYGEDDSQVLLKTVGQNGLITLNRPDSLNAYNLSMLKKLYTVLKEWESQKKLVIVQGAGDKAFCTGGDIRLTKYILHPGGIELMKGVAYSIYRLIYLVNGYKIPYVTLMNNLIMGGGGGLSVAGKYRVVTERSVFAMPEAAAGFQVDAGFTYTFPRLEGYLGYYLGLTGHRLKGTDIVKAGIGTHYVPAERLNHLRKELLENDGTTIESVFGKYEADISAQQFSLAPFMKKINTCFSAATVEDMIARLEEDNSDWSKNVIKRLKEMSPTSLKVIKTSFDKGKEMTFGECLKMEYRLACTSLFAESDFIEGTRALLIDKDKKPNWNPKHLKDVTTEAVMKRFELLPPEEELKF